MSEIFGLSASFNCDAFLSRFPEPKCISTAAHPFGLSEKSQLKGILYPVMAESVEPE